jgi:hypothetical protein
MKLEWASAEVKDGTLTVGLESDPPKEWRRSFERTATLLGNGDWGEIQLAKGAVRVARVTAGSEDKLRHHLEAIVAQANAANEEGETDEDGDEPEGPDAEMTERFKAFAEEDEAE